MVQVPEINISHPGIVVDALEFRAPLFGLFGTPSWEVRWRLVENPEASATSLLREGVTGGSGEIGGRYFTYAARWHDGKAVPPQDGEPVVTPGAVLRLAEFSRRR